MISLFPMPERKLLTVSAYLSAAALVFMILFVVAFSAWPEMADDDAPEIALSGMADGGTYQGVVPLALEAKDETTAVGRVSVTVDGAVVFNRDVGEKQWTVTFDLDTAAFSEGEHRLVLSVTDTSIFRRERKLDIAFRIDRTPPRLALRSFKEAVLQGDTGGLIIRSDEELSAMNVSAFGKSVACYPLSGRERAYRALFGVSTFQKPGVHEIQCTARDAAGNETTETALIRVTAKKFPFETIALPQEKRGILHDSEKIRNDQKIVAQALSSCGDIQLWRGAFIRPAQGIDSSAFGTRRVYETGGTASSHQGIDIANKEGTPVEASNAGVVVFAGELFVTGNTVIIDHGQGVVSFYYHMKELKTEEGEALAKGSVIGTMGSTGLSTGSHCHWELRVGGQSVNPDDWRQMSFEPGD